MNIDYNHKVFRAISNTETGEVDEGTRFYYFQQGQVIWATYKGAQILFGTITGIVSEDSSLDFAYQHINTNQQIRTGRCKSTPEIVANGKIRLREIWRWTDGTEGQGKSIIEEI